LACPVNPFRKKTKLRKENQKEKKQMKNKILSPLIAIVLVLAAVLVVTALWDSAEHEAQAQSDFTLSASGLLWNTETLSTNGASHFVTNKAIASGVSAFPNVYHKSVGKEVAFHFYTGATPFTVGTNVVVRMSTSAFQTGTYTNRATNFFNITLTNSSTHTNIFVGAREYIYLDYVTPTGVTLSNFQVRVKSL
jgi:hypothetical protein